MAIDNLNPRRTVWFSKYAPQNKYDIWLSTNAHFDEEENETIDSNVQRKCDYIFKVYDCGEWKSITGFNSTALNKMNIVKGSAFTCVTPNGFDYTSAGYEKFHLPLFRSIEDSPDELFDAGTLGEAILKYVTEEEWGDIFDSDWFTDAFNEHVIEGDDYNWGDLIQELISSGDIEIPLANTQRIGGIKAALDPDSSDEPRNIPIVLAGPNQGSVWGKPFGSGYYPQDKYPGDLDEETEYLYLPGWALMEWMKDPYPDQQNSQLFVSGWRGVDTELRPDSDLIWAGLSGLTPAKAGNFCMAQVDNTDPSGCSIEWKSPEYIVKEGTGVTNNTDGYLHYDATNGFGWTSYEDIYPVLSTTDYANDKEYVVNGPGGKPWDLFLQGDGAWIKPSLSKLLDVSINNTLSNGQALVYDAIGDYWTNKDISDEISYNSGTGINIDSNNNINIDVEGASDGQVLSYDQSTGNVVWKDETGIYQAGDGIEIDSNTDTIKSTVSVSNTEYAADDSVEFRCAVGSQMRNAISLLYKNTDEESPQTAALNPYTFTKVTLNPNGKDVVRINISNEITYIGGKPVYILLHISKGVSAPFVAESPIIDEGGVVTESEGVYHLSDGDYLITLQFNIARIEKVKTLE